MQLTCPASVNSKDPVHLHDNAWPDVSQQTLQKLNKLGYKTLPQPSHSPDLSLTGYHFFQLLDDFFQEKVFNASNAVQNGNEDFVAFHTPNIYSRGITALVSCWQKCVESNGEK